MKFEINVNTNWYVLDVDKKGIGLKHLQEARKELGVHFNAELLVSNISALRKGSLNIQVTEKEAVSLGVFEDDCYQGLRVNSGFFNDCVEEILKTERDEDDDAITEVWYEYKLNEEKAKAKVFDYIKNELKESE